MTSSDQGDYKKEPAITAARITGRRTIIGAIITSLVGGVFLIVNTYFSSPQSTVSPPMSETPTHQITYKIMYKNISNVQQNDVVVRAILHGNAQYVGGSTQVAMSSTSGKWSPVSDNSIVGSGMHIGSFAPGGNAYIKFLAYAIADCKHDNATDEISAVSDSGGDAIQTTLQVTKEC